MQSDDELIDSEEKTSIIEMKDRIFLEEADEFEKDPETQGDEVSRALRGMLGDSDEL